MPCTAMTSSRTPSLHTHTHPHHEMTKTNNTPRLFTHPSIPAGITQPHTHSLGQHQCSSAVTHVVSAPASAVWSLLRRFDCPQAYKHFVKSCHVDVSNPNAVGSLRHLRLVSGIPAVTSTERLEILDDDRHVMSFKVVGGEHRLRNYCSVTTLHECSSSGVDGAARTVVVESYVVDVPAENTWEDTCSFVDTIVRCNLQSLGEMAEKLVKAAARN